ncbi:MAG: phage major capsid protein [Selenomonadaceae bacterium]|nr:phage major capsid protein [Selenomonadaceae bacterium]
MNEELKAWCEELAKLAAEMQAFLDEHEDEEGNLTEEDATTYDAMDKKLNALRKKIDRKEKLLRANNFLDSPVNGTSYNKPILPDPRAGIFAGKTDRTSDVYKKAMMLALRTNFRQVSNLLEESTAAQGGFLVPTEWDTRLIQTLEEENVMRTLGTRITTEGEHKINIVASKPAASWVAEGQPLTFGNAAFAQKTLDAYKLAVGIQVTNELLYDNVFDLESYIVNEFGKAIGNAEEDVFINGTGINQPTGFLTTLEEDATTYITTTGANISADDIINLEYSLKRPYRRNAVFLCNDSTLAILRKFKDSTQNYLWTPSFVQGEADRLLGYPIYTTPYFPTAQSGEFAIAFGDFRYYNIAERGTRTVRELRELYAIQDISAFMMIERIDGILVDTNAIRALKVK